MSEEEVAQRLLKARVEGDVEYLIESLRAPRWRNVSAHFLSRLGDERAVEPLARLLDVSDADVRGSAAQALSRLPSHSAADKLLDRARHDDDRTVRQWAIHALAEIGDRRAVPLLLPLVDVGRRRDREWAVKHLESLGDPRAIETLRAVGASSSWLRRRRLNRAIRTIEDR